jgi:hypothetical protein
MSINNTGEMNMQNSPTTDIDFELQELSVKHNQTKEVIKIKKGKNGAPDKEIKKLVYVLSAKERAELSKKISDRCIVLNNISRQNYNAKSASLFVAALSNLPGFRRAQG